MPLPSDMVVEIRECVKEEMRPLCYKLDEVRVTLHGTAEKRDGGLVGDVSSMKDAMKSIRTLVFAIGAPVMVAAIIGAGTLLFQAISFQRFRDQPRPVQIVEPAKP